MRELVGKDIKTTIINIFHIFKKIEESMSIRRRGGWDLNQSLEAKIQYLKWGGEK